MAFSLVLRKTASMAAPLIARAVVTPKNCRSALFTPLKSGFCRHISRSGAVFSHHFSSIATKKPSSDQNLLKVVESEIKCAEESDDRDRVDEVPEGFPFTIEDNPGEQTIKLKREYHGETITVEVHMPDLVTGNEEDNRDDDDDDESNNQSNIPLVVNITKGSGPSLEFNVSAYPDEVSIDSLSIREQEPSEDQIAYEGPDFGDLDENLQKALHKYLEIRGIKASTTNFLHEYMLNKDSREYTVWLQTLKNFIEK